MTGSELIQRLASKYTDLSHRDMDAIVKTILQSIGDHLSKDGRVEVRGFGSFQNHITPPKRGRNPKTGETVTVPEKRRPSFKAGKELRERVDAKR